MTPDTPTAGLGRREREIMDVVFRLGRGSVAEVRSELDDAPSYSSVRTMLNLLESKGHLRHREEGRKYVYEPTMEERKARRSALRHLIETFFDGSASALVSALVKEDGDLSRGDLDALAGLIERAREESDP